MYLPFFCLLISFDSWTKVISFEPSNLSRKFHPFNEVCEHFGFKNNLMINPQGNAELDCMSRRANITKFCISKYGKGLLRGKVDKISKNVLCEFADTLRVKVECVGRDEKLCDKKEDSCLKLKEVFAVGLDLIDSSMDKKILTCTYLNNAEKDLSIDAVKAL